MARSIMPSAMRGLVANPTASGMWVAARRCGSSAHAFGTSTPDRCYAGLSANMVLILAASATMVNGFVTTCMPRSKCPLPTAALSA